VERRAIGSALVVLASVSVAGAAAALVAVMTQPSPVETAQELPHGIELAIPPVIAASDRAVSPTVLATAHVAVAGTAPGIALETVMLSRRWEESRAEIRDLTTGDLRAYAIGDLLPHGSLLVGLSTRTADVLVGDVELVRLEIGVAPRLVEDFRASYEAMQRARQDSAETAYRAAVEGSVRTLASASAETVQAHIDELIDCGDPAVEILIHHVGDASSIAPGPYQLPTGSGVTVEPNAVGDAVIAVLEIITGQTFGDPARATGEERAEIARAWERWWGLP
jgi:hypothetical protein